MPSLTRAEALDRARLLTVQRYDIALDLARGDTRFGSEVDIHWTGLGTGPTFLDVKAEALHAAELDGRPLEPAAWSAGRLPLTVTPGEHVLRVVATMAYRRDGSGMHRAVDPADGAAYVYVQSFLDFAPAVFACFDQPDLKARLALRVRAPQDWIVIANGAATQQGPGEWVCAQTPPVATYLFTVCGGPFVSVRADHDGIPLGLHARAALHAELHRWAPQLLEVTGAALDVYHRLFGIRYPFGDYDQVFVTDFNAIAMENPGCVTIRDELLFRGVATPDEVQRRTRTVVHELAHMWFGNLATMRWWDDLWLNESFAEYLAHRVLTDATAFEQAWVDFGIVRKGWGYAAERAPTTHPVAGAAAESAADALANFDGISYAKGASAIRQLIEYVGDEAFVAGVAAYLRDKAYGNGTFAEFVATIEQASGVELGEWARLWLRTAGRETFAVDASASPPVLVRSASERHPAPGRPHVLEVGAYAADGAASVVRVRSTAERVPLPDLAVPDAPRVLLPNSSDLTWAAVDLDEQSLQAVPDVLGRIEQPLARSVLWQVLRDGVARAAVDPRVYLAAVQRSWPLESYIALLQNVADEAIIVARLHLPPDQAAAAQRDLARVGGQVLAGAEPGGPHAVVAARLVARCSADEALLRDWLDRPPAGLHDDVDFRWLVLSTLARHGLVRPGELAAASAADRSVAGALAALRAEASVPTAEAKAWAIAELVRPHTTRSSHELVELARGLWIAPDPGLVREHVGSYLDGVEAMTAWVGADALKKVTRFGFPRVVEQRTIDLVDAALARPDLPAPVRRDLLEWSWPVREALLSRRRFPA